MKNILKYGIISFGVLLSACAKEVGDTDIRRDAISFSASALPSRTAIQVEEGVLSVSWAEGDAIGIFGVCGTGSTGDNYPYGAIVNGEDPSRCGFEPQENIKVFSYGAAAQQTFHAYYPYAEMEGATATALPVSVPAVQTQSGSLPTAHVAANGVMVASPVSVMADDPQAGAVNFTFSNIFSIVELRMKLTAASAIGTVPVKSIELTSAAAPLAFEGTLDLTQGVTAVTSGYNSLLLNLENNLNVAKSDYASAFMLVKPGSHNAGDIVAEITAIDGSVNRVTLGGAIDFQPNVHYTKSIELAVEDFIATNPFDITANTLECSVGESVGFTISGVAANIEFWSGEVGNDYAYKDTNRTVEPKVEIEFRSLLENGYQRYPATVHYSTDFNGTYDETNIKAATWVDVTDKFTIPTAICAVDEGYPAVGNDSAPVASGKVDCSQWFNANREGYFAIFYHVNTYDANWVDPVTQTKTGNGRTYFWLFDIDVEASFEGEAAKQSLFEFSDSSVTVVAGSNYPSGEKYSVWKAFTSYPYAVRLYSTFRPTTDRDAYLITDKLGKPAAKDVGKDSPVNVPDGETSWSHSFREPGTYNCRFIADEVTLTGTTRVEREFTITVKP